jgi:hypothetical protein
MGRDVHLGCAVTVNILIGDCRERMAELPADSFDACVTDPPYGLSFMGKGWDAGVPGVEFWAAVFRVLKPGAHLLAFSGTRTQHRMVCAIEDAGFEIRDQIGWCYGSGFPKSLDVSKAIDKAAGAERAVIGPKANVHSRGEHRLNEGWRRPWMDDPEAVQRGMMETAPATPEAAAWQGWGTALKPAWEPICVARKPLIGTVAANVLAHGTGALNIDATRIGTDGGTSGAGRGPQGNVYGDGLNGAFGTPVDGLGRWPANLAHDGSDEVLACFPETTSGALRAEVQRGSFGRNAIYGNSERDRTGTEYAADTGSAARFFYCAKASRSERGEGNNHPTVKPVALMRWLVRLVTPAGGHVLDPFGGSGTTGLAASIEQVRSTLIEMDPAYAAIAQARLDAEMGMFARAAE